MTRPAYSCSNFLPRSFPAPADFEHPGRWDVVTYITALLEAGAEPLVVCRQTGTSLAMIEKHYGASRTDADDLDRLLGEAGNHPSKPKTRNPPGTLSENETRAPPRKRKKPSAKRNIPVTTTDRDHRNDIQLGKLDVIRSLAGRYPSTRSFSRRYPGTAGSRRHWKRSGERSECS
ncbi:MAG: hypothetical protein P8R42_11655 [Candidatus Binatia bacterium]|nr:hypothetical protein [Candidatus Binatia bacterium]